MYLRLKFSGERFNLNIYVFPPAPLPIALANFLLLIQ